MTAASAAAVHLYDSTVVGPVRLTGTTGSVAVVDSSVTGALQVERSATPGIEPVLAGNVVVGPLTCTANTPAPIDLGAPNEITGPTSGQCLGMGI